MIAIVSVALRRRYTFIVLMLFGMLAAVRTPADIFPNSGMPAVTVVRSRNGGPPPAMPGGIPHYFQRSAATPVNDIPHMVSRSFRSTVLLRSSFRKPSIYTCRCRAATPAAPPSEV